jgi:3-dehydrotetronate 4-kinase
MIGVIADDFTGGTDVAAAFRRAGLRTALYFGLPEQDALRTAADVVVISLKTRTAPTDEAVTASVTSARWLREHGAHQLFFKFCSTFDSTAQGNIGPVGDALAELVGSRTTVVVPSSPDHKRTQYLGYLFVGDELLAESPMRHHPLTPMTDSSVPRLLRAQTARPVDLIRLHDVRGGAHRIRDLLTSISARTGYAVIDAVEDSDLLEIGRACLNEPLLTGAAGLAAGLGAAVREQQAARRDSDTVVGTAGVDGPAVALAGSCSARTLEQIADMRRTHPSFHLVAAPNASSSSLAAAALRWYDDLDPNTPAPLIYSSLPPHELRLVQDALGSEAASLLLETALGQIAVGLRARGVRRFVIAGGETSGAVVTALGVDGGLVGDEVAPGVPWIHTFDETPVSLLLKSGNFGGTSLLTDATVMTPSARTRQVTVA